MRSISMPSSLRARYSFECLLAKGRLQRPENKVGLSATWLTKEYMPQLAALVLIALTRMAKDSDEGPSQSGLGKASVECNAGSEGCLQREPARYKALER